MKKGFKIFSAVAGLAALAALVPYSVKKDEEKDETTAYALLWKYTNKPNPEGNRTISIDIGFHNPAEEEIDDLLMGENDLILVDAPVVEEPACDIELTLTPNLDEIAEEPVAPAVEL